MSSLTPVSLSVGRRDSDLLVDWLESVQLAEDAEDDDSAATPLMCEVCGKQGEFSEGRYHEDSRHYRLGSISPDLGGVAHAILHDSCLKGWTEAAIESGTCSICPGKAKISSINGREISELRKEAASEGEKDSVSKTQDAWESKDKTESKGDE